MATLRGLIPVTVGTFEAYHGGVGGGYHWGGGGGGLGTQSAGLYITYMFRLYLYLLVLKKGISITVPTISTVFKVSRVVLGMEKALCHLGFSKNTLLFG